MLDLDGTLIKTYDALPSPEVTAALQKAKNKIHIGLASSRAYILLKHILNYLQLTGPSIIQGGSRIIDSSSGAVIWEQLIKVKDLNKIFEILTNCKIHFVINDDGKYYDYNTDYVPYKPLHIWVKQILPVEVGNKIVDSLSSIPSIKATTAPASTDKDRVQIVITHISATKQHAILEVAKVLKIKPSEIIGVGDGDNDFPLLMACGLKVAMGNANDDLKAIADYVAPSVDQDGVADIIEKFIVT